MSTLEIQTLSEENVGYYQTNTCEFSYINVMSKNFDNFDVEYLPDASSRIKCHGKINGVDIVQSKIKVYIGTNLNLDLLIQSFFWLFVIYLIPKSREENNFRYVTPSIFIIVLLTTILHFSGENQFYKSLNQNFDSTITTSNFLILSLIVTIFFVFQIVFDLLKTRYLKLLNYFPYLFLFVGTYNTLNLNFFFILISILGLISLFEKNINIKFTILYLIFSIMFLINSENVNLYFDVDKLKGLMNSSQTYYSQIFWIALVYLFLIGLNKIFKDSINRIDLDLLKNNFLISAGIMVILGVFSAVNPIISFFTYYYFGLNKFGMKYINSIEGNTWRGLSASAEAVGEYLVFTLVFLVLIYQLKKFQFNFFQIILFIPIIYGIIRANNVAAIVSGLGLLIIYFLNKYIQFKNKILIISLLFSAIFILFFFLNRYYFVDYTTKGLLYHATLSAELNPELTENQWGISAAEEMNFGLVLEKNEEQDFLSTSLNFLLDNYTYGGDIKYIPNVISIISFVSVIINRSEKWGIFIAKYDPNLFELLFGYGPSQLGEYYLGHETKFNDGLYLPHSSLLDLLIFIGLFGILGILYFSLKIFKNNYSNYIYSYSLIFLILNLLKSDSILYLNSFVLCYFIFNLYKNEEIKFK